MGLHELRSFCVAKETPECCSSLQKGHKYHLAIYLMYWNVERAPKTQNTPSLNNPTKKWAKKINSSENIKYNDQ